MIIKHCIVQDRLGNAPPELTSADLEKIPTEHQLKFINENYEKY